MGYAITDFMAGWLNSTYAYLQQTGGPTYPPATVGPNVMPGGAYSLKEDYPITEIAITRYKDTAPISFNPYTMGLPALKPNQNIAIDEIAKQNPTPTIISKAFETLFGDMMNACIADQKERACNPNADQACRDLADRGDISGISLASWHREALGLPSLLHVTDKPDEILKAENEATLTAQIKGGTGKMWAGLKSWGDLSILSRKLTNPVNPAPARPTGDPNNPEGSNFQAIGNSVKSFIDPFIPKAPSVAGIAGVNSGTLIMVGGGVLLLILVIAVIK